MNKTLLVVLAFVGVFACGSIVGGVAVMRFGRPKIQAIAADQFAIQQWKRVADQLHLTPEQREKIRPIYIRAAQDRQAILRQTQTVHDRMNTDISAVLSPEQKNKFKELYSRQKDSDRLWQRWIKEQRARRGEAPPTPIDNAAPSKENPTAK